MFWLQLDTPAVFLNCNCKVTQNLQWLAENVLRVCLHFLEEAGYLRNWTRHFDFVSCPTDRWRWWEIGSGPGGRTDIGSQPQTERSQWRPSACRSLQRTQHVFICSQHKLMLQNITVSHRSLYPWRRRGSSWAALSKPLFLQNANKHVDNTHQFVCKQQSQGGAALVQQAAPSLWQCAHRCRCGSVCGTAAGSLCSTHTTPHRRRSTHTDAPTPANTAETHHGSAMWGTCDRFNISHEKNSNRINLQVMQLTYNYDQDEIITSFIFHHNWQKNRESRRFNHSVSFLVNRVNWVWADGGNIQENPTLGTKMFISICFILVSF